MKSGFFLLFVLLSLSLSPSFAGQIYKHVPFTVSISTGDVIVAEYDFSRHSGIYCTSDYDKLWVDFSFNGYPKSAILPVTLLNHLSQVNGEEEADVSGQLTLFISKEKINDKHYNVSCDWLENK